MTAFNRTIPPLSDEDEARIQRLIADDPDASEASDEQLAQAKPFVEAFPQFAEAVRRARGRPPVDSPRQQVSLRLDPDVIEAYRRTGKGWQGRINDILRKAIKV